LAIAASRGASSTAAAHRRAALQHAAGRPQHGLVQNISIEYRYAEGRPERLPEFASELVGWKPDVMFALGGDVAPFLELCGRLGDEIDQAAW
jgi:hypothetical protein